MTEATKAKETRSKRSTISSRQKNKLIFYCTMIVLPVIQFCVFYIYINFQSFTLAFQEYSQNTDSYFFVGFKNFRQFFSDLQTVNYLKASIVNSFTLFFFSFIFGSLVAIMFSYYIYKKNVGSMFFKIMLYLPQILGGVVLVIIYKFFLEDAIPDIALKLFGKEIRGLLSNQATERTMIIFFSIYISFGTRILVYSSAMSGISDSIIESAQLDGITPLKELVLIIIPSIWGTFVTFMVNALLGLFTNQMALFTFYGTDAGYSLYTFGYFLYRGAKVATYADYPYMSAVGLVLTAIATPLTLFARWALTKFGPSKE